MKKCAYAVLAAAIPSLAVAAPEDATPEQYFSKSNPVLTRQERAALAISQRWTTASAAGAAPAPGADGSVVFTYGSMQPSIVCAVLQVCDVQLQPGEQVNSLHLGDTVRWTVEPAVTGVAPAEVQHLIIKPLDVGLDTSLVVTTDRRTYHMRLRSHRTQFMPKVSFAYPDEAQAKWDALRDAARAREAKERERATLPAAREYLGNLSFDYSITGRAAWKPVRVYNDGTKTIIQMPRAIAQAEAPTLLVVRRDGGLFSDDDTVMVNYRLQGDRYIVDAVFDKAILIAGVGASQDRVTIEKGQ